MESIGLQVSYTLQSLGELVALSPVFQEFRDLVPTDQAKLPSVTCAVKVTCSPLSRSGEDGTERLTPTRRDTPLLLLWLPPPAHHSSRLVVTESRKFQSSHWLLIASMLIPPRLYSRPSKTLVPPPISTVLVTSSIREPVKERWETHASSSARDLLSSMVMQMQRLSNPLATFQELTFAMFTDSTCSSWLQVATSVD